MSIVLAIEVSQHVGGVALRDRQGKAHVEMLAPRKRHDDDLLPAIDRLLSRAGLSPDDLRGESGGAVAVSVGPGGFTGLRIAVTTAKMLAEALGTNVIAVPSALVAAESTIEALSGHAGSQRLGAELNAGAAPIMVCLAAKADSCWCTQVVRESGAWRIAGEPGLRTAETLDVQGIAAVLADAHFPEPMRRRCEQNGVRVIEPAFDPRACLEVAERMLREGLSTDPLSLTPRYPREPEAVTLWERKASRGEAGVQAG